MINHKSVQVLIDNIQPDTDLNRGLRWVKSLGLDLWTDVSIKWLGEHNVSIKLENYAFTTYILQQAIFGTIGDFNYWEEDGEIKWPDLSAADWFKVIRHEKPLYEMNLPELREQLWKAAIDFMPTFEIPDIYTLEWWNKLSEVYGNDPLRKRETLLWIILTDLGFPNLPTPNRGCIDYNIILAFRYLKIIVGYNGSSFGIKEETDLRFECLSVIEQVLDARPDLSISDLDSLLYKFGKYIQHTVSREEWEPFFCYRPGCFYY